jgi:transcriptional regulator with XRE-family HTH domain
MSGFKCPYCDGTGLLIDEAAHLGARILAARKATGMTQQDLAGKVGRSRSQIANIEGGRTDIPVSLLARFAEALGVKPSELLP